MIEQQRQRVEQVMTELVDEMDKTHLRKLQAKMHYCAAKCCEDNNASTDTVQNCVARCSKPLNHAQNYLQTELESFQARLQRCVMQCNDEIKVQIPPKASEEEIVKFTNQFERCAVKCVDKHIGQVPKMLKTINMVLTKPEA